MTIAYVDLKVLNGDAEHFGTVCLVLHNGQPVLLGEGAFARVYLGSTAHTVAEGAAIALKFLMTNESKTAERNFRRRFLQEVRRTHDCQRWNLGAHVVSFVGFGRTEAFDPADHALLEEAFASAPASSFSHEGTLIPNGLLSKVDEKFRTNAEALAKENVKIKDTTGEFYAMQLCLVSLEEVLLTVGTPLDFSAHAALTKVGATTAIGEQIVRWEKNFESSLLLRGDSNGFQDLAVLDAKWREGAEVSPATSLRSAVQFALAHRCLQRVAGLHRVRLAANPTSPQSGEYGYAHRDIKPGNILLSLEDPTKLLLADLGWVATAAEIRKGNLTLGTAIEEGGALPRGTRGFQAPEQIQSSETVSFTVVPREKRVLNAATGASDSETEIAIFSHFSKPQPGDWLFVKRLFASGAMKARITDVQPDQRGDSRCLIPTVLLDPEGLIKGQFVKDVSLHSDIFSVGLLAYYIGSEGRDPEEFIATFLSANRREIMKGQLPGWVLESPFWFAAVLCQQEPAILKADATHCLKHPVENTLTENGKVAPNRELDAARLQAICNPEALLAEPSTFQRAADLMFGSSKGVELVSTEDIRKIGNYRKNIAGNKTLREMLIGRVEPKHPISFPQLYLCLLCCLRNAEDSVVRRQLDIVSRNGDSKGVYHERASEFARQIDMYAMMVKDCPSLKVDLGHWATHGDALSLFIAARLGAPREPSTVTKPKMPAESPSAR